MYIYHVTSRLFSASYDAFLYMDYQEGEACECGGVYQYLKILSKIVGLRYINISSQFTSMIFYILFGILITGRLIVEYLVYIGKIKPYRGLKSTTKKGEKVKSRSEKRVADYLYRHNIVYVYEQGLKLNTKKGTKRVKPDFYLPDHDVYIEFWGLNTKKYNSQKRWKMKHYKTNNISYISLYARDLKILNKKLGMYKISPN